MFKKLDLKKKKELERKCEVFERQYLLNPFMLQTSTDEELSQVINDLAKQYRNSDLAYDVVFNINLESDLLMIYGEFIARLQQQASLKKIEADNLEDKSVYQLRTDWIKSNTDKPPAMSYFEAQAREIVKDIRVEQIKAETMLIRFKKAYSSLETKQNALKKKLDAMRYEEV